LREGRAGGELHRSHILHRAISAASPTSVSSSPSSSPVLNRAIFDSQSLNSIDEGQHRDSDDIEVTIRSLE
ncbi:hypothetical protein Dimus_013599, partial [Dionaea muscipula]